MIVVTSIASISWRASAGAIYRNWLQYVVSKRANATVFPAMAAAHTQQTRQRSKSHIAVAVAH